MGYEKISLTCRAGDLGEMVMKEDVLSIDEIVVTPQILNTFGNRERLTLGESSRKIGNNALDAIGRMPQFKMGSDSRELSTVDNKSVLVLIDGIRRSSGDLMLLRAEDIKEIQFYSEPPARYAHENIGAVIDVTTRKRTDRLYSLYLDTKNGVTTGYGTDMLSLAYRDSLNMVTAAYFIDYRALDDNHMHNTYAYADKTNEYGDFAGGYRGQYHIGQVSYQRYQGNDLFNAKLEHRRSPGRQEYTLESDRRMLESDYSSASADLYYMHMFNRDRNISLNVLNTYYTSGSDNILSNGAGGYSFENHIANRSYSLIAEMLYCDKLWGGDFSLGAYYQYKNLDQEYNSEMNSTVKTRREYVHADYSKAVGKISYNVGMGLENIHYDTATGESYNYLVFRPSVTVNLQYDKHSALRLTASVRSSVPNIGDLTGSMVTVDEHFYTQGNTGLRPYHYWYANLSYKYASEDGRLYLAPSLSYSYYPDKNMPILFSAGEDVILRMSNIRDVHFVQASMSLSYRPFKWVAVQPFYNYGFSGYMTPNSTVRHSMHNAGASVQLLPGNLQVILNANLPITTVDGDIYTRMGLNTTASVLYKFKTMSVGLEYIHNPHPSRVYADMDGFSYSEDIVWNNFRNLVSVKFTCYLHKGKSRGHAGKRISNSDSDSGLTKSNTAK